MLVGDPKDEDHRQDGEADKSWWSFGINEHTIGVKLAMS